MSHQAAIRLVPTELISLRFVNRVNEATGSKREVPQVFFLLGVAPGDYFMVN